MTIQLELPPELEERVRLYAEASGHDVATWLISVLLDKIRYEPIPTTIPRLQASVYPLEPLTEDTSYENVPFPIAGYKDMAFYPVGNLQPTPYPEDE